MNYRIVQKKNWIRIRSTGIFKYSCTRTISANIGIFFGVLLSIYFDVIFVRLINNSLNFFSGEINIFQIDWRYLVGIIIISMILMFYCFQHVFKANEKRYDLTRSIEYSENA